MSHNHDTHFLIKGQFEWVMYLLKYEFIIENDDTLYIIENDVFLIYSKIVMSRDSDWNHKIQNEPLYINQV